MVTNQSGQVESRRDFMPFGEDIAAGTGGRSSVQGYGADSTRQKFVTYERDIESDLDFAQARYYKYSHGRFTSPDPYNIVAEVQVEKNAEKAKKMLDTYANRFGNQRSSAIAF